MAGMPSAMEGAHRDVGLQLEAAFARIADKPASDCNDAFSMEEAHHILGLLSAHRGTLLPGHAKKLLKVAQLCVDRLSEHNLMSALLVADTVNIDGTTIEASRQEPATAQDIDSEEALKQKAASEVRARLLGDEMTTLSTGLHHVTLEEAVNKLQHLSPTTLSYAFTHVEELFLDDHLKIGHLKKLNKALRLALDLNLAQALSHHVVNPF
eukprot:m.50560 g.50560  ORF g.50560 m.50560 type:complete len:210 (+) comp12560_c1_seq2:128-757(+)